MVLFFDSKFVFLVRIIMAAQRSGCGHYTFVLFLMVAHMEYDRPLYFIQLFVLLLLSSSFFFSSPNLSRRKLDVCHISTRGVALVRI